jgi:hypothetical protein
VHYGTRFLYRDDVKLCLPAKELEHLACACSHAYDVQHLVFVVLWAQVPMGVANGCGSMLSGRVQSLRLSAQVQRGLGEALLQQWHLWLVDPPLLSVIWRVMVLATIWAMEQGRKRLWSLVHAPPRQGCAVQQTVSKPSTSFWST